MWRTTRRDIRPSLCVARGMAGTIQRPCYHTPAVEVQRERRRRAANGHWLSKDARREFLMSVLEKETEEWERERHTLARGMGLSSERDIEAGNDIGRDELLMRREKLSTKRIHELGGGGFLAFYGGSLRRAYVDLLGEREAQKWTRAPRGQWNDIKWRREFFVSLAKTLRVTNVEEWAFVTNAQVRDFGGSALFRHFPSLLSALRETLDDVSAEEWDRVERLKRVRYARGDIWKSEEAVKLYMYEVKREWDIKTAEDWARVSLRTMKRSLLRRMSLTDALAIAFPEEDWRTVRFNCTSQSKKSAQRKLIVGLHHILL